jgi:hypothetical protein
MCDGIQITSPDGSQLCIPLYVEVERWPDGPHPDPWRIRFRDLITIEREQPTWAKDLQVIVTIDRLVASLGNTRLQEQFGGVLTDAVHTLSAELPANVTVGDAVLSGSLSTKTS